MSQPLKKTLVGDCECCTTSINVEVFIVNGMTMCAACVERQEKFAQATKIIDDSKKIDYSIRISADLAQAETVAIVELIAAVKNDSSIADDMKDYEVARLCQDRVIAYQKAIFDKRQEILDFESRLRVSQTNAQEFAGKLKKELKDKLQPQFNMNYQPDVKQIKPTRTSRPSSNFKVSELRDAARKYNLEMEDVRSIAVSRNLTAEGAAKYLRELLDAKKKKQQN